MYLRKEPREDTDTEESSESEEQSSEREVVEEPQVYCSFSEMQFTLQQKRLQISCRGSGTNMRCKSLMSMMSTARGKFSCIPQKWKTQKSL